MLDEKPARRFALALGLPVSGTLGILRDASDKGLLDLQEALARLTRTGFRYSPGLLREILDR